MTLLAHLSALLGGFVLCAMIIITCTSILGRAIRTLGHSDLLRSISNNLADIIITSGVGPILGDVEWVEIGMAFVVFAFLPLCQLQSGHARVDLLENIFSIRANSFILGIWEILLAGAMLLITIQLHAGMQAKMANNEVTFFIQIPIWWGYTASLSVAVIGTTVGIYCAWARIFELLVSTPVSPNQNDLNS